MNIQLRFVLLVVILNSLLLLLLLQFAGLMAVIQRQGMREQMEGFEQRLQGIISGGAGGEMTWNGGDCWKFEWDGEEWSHDGAETVPGGVMAVVREIEPPEAGGVREGGLFYRVEAEGGLVAGRFQRGGAGGWRMEMWRLEGVWLVELLELAGYRVELQLVDRGEGQNWDGLGLRHELRDEYGRVVAHLVAVPRWMESFQPGSEMGSYFFFLLLVLGSGTMAISGVVYWGYVMPVRRLIRGLARQDLVALERQSRQGGEFGVLARLVGKALQQERELGRLMEERQALGRDMHDGLIQILFALGLQLENLRQARGGDGELSRMLGEARQQVNRGIEQARLFIKGNAEQPCTEEEFNRELRGLCENAQQLGRGKVRLELEPEVLRGLEDGRRRELLGFFSEALSNAVRHAEAREIRVILGRRRAAVEDDGKGIPEPAPAGGFGLRNMQLRAHRLDAVYRLARRGGGGTVVELQWDA